MTINAGSEWTERAALIYRDQRDALRSEIDRLRALIIDWVDADDTWEGGPCDCGGEYCTAAQALRRAVGQ